MTQWAQVVLAGMQCFSGQCPWVSRQALYKWYLLLFQKKNRSAVRETQGKPLISLKVRVLRGLLLWSFQKIKWTWRCPHKFWCRLIAVFRRDKQCKLSIENVLVVSSSFADVTWEYESILPMRKVNSRCNGLFTDCSIMHCIDDMENESQCHFFSKNT